MHGPTDDAVLREAAALAARREPFALATVVWRRAPASGKPGGKALVTADGRLHGWVGGACAEPAVIQEARRALSEGTPRLLHLGPPDEAPAGGEGRVVMPMTCASEGALEVFIEPHLPRPHLAVVGRAPVVRALADMAGTLGFEVAVVDREGMPPGVERAVPELDLGRAGVGPGSFVVVATMGHYDEEALEAALETEASYVALVASRKRAATVLDYLRGRGLSREQLDRVRAPAGLDLGPVTHEEIAVAVLAEIVQLKAAGAGAVRPPAAPREEAVDPVCGMTVDVATARYTAEHAGEAYYFCSAGCRTRFQANPAAFLAAT